MPRIAALFAPAALAMALLAPSASVNAAAAPTVNAGYWEYKIKAFGVTVGTEYWCVKPDQVDKFFNGPCNRHHTCTYPTRQVANGKARFIGTWKKNNDGDITNVDASGDYTPTRFTLKTKATMGSNGVPIPPMTVDAKWQGATCKPGAKTPS